MLNIGLYFDLRNPAADGSDWSRRYAFILELCEEVDRLGAHSVWLTEHHLFEDGYLSQPLAYAAAIAARTRRIRIGTAVVLAPFRNVIHLAEEAAVVDLVSAGRLELGLGSGYRVPEFQLFGADISRRFADTDASARSLRRLWTEDRLKPPMVQQYPRIWMGYQGPKGARRAGLLGECLLSANPVLVKPYMAGLQEAGHDPGKARMAGGVGGWITDDPEADWPLVRRHLAYQWDSYNRYLVEGTGQRVPNAIDPERWRARGLGAAFNSFLLATPEEAAAALHQHVTNTPIETMWFFTDIAGMPEDLVVRHAETLVTKLAPLLAGHPSGQEDD